MSNNTTVQPIIKNLTIYFSVIGCLGSLSFLLNGLVLFTLWRNKTKEFRNGTSLIIGNLALADSLTGVAVLLYVCRCVTIKGLQLSMIWTTILASLLSLILLSIERFIAFAYSFKVAVVTVRRTIVALLGIWLLSISCGVFVFFYKNQSVFALTVIYESAVLIFTVCHMLIYTKMVRMNKQLQKFSRNTSSSSLSSTINRPTNVHVNKMILILIAVLVVTVLPYIVATQLIFWHRLKFTPSIDKATVNEITKFAIYFYPIELLNFVVNPLIYSWRLKRYRRAFVEAINCCRLKVSGRLFSSQNNNIELSPSYGTAKESVSLYPTGCTSV